MLVTLQQNQSHCLFTKCIMTSSKVKSALSSCLRKNTCFQHQGALVPHAAEDRDCLVCFILSLVLGTLIITTLKGIKAQAKNKRWDLILSQWFFSPFGSLTWQMKKEIYLSFHLSFPVKW